MAMRVVPVSPSGEFYDLLRVQRNAAGDTRLEYHSSLNDPRVLDKLLAAVRRAVLRGNTESTAEI